MKEEGEFPRRKNIISFPLIVHKNSEKKEIMWSSEGLAEDAECSALMGGPCIPPHDRSVTIKKRGRQ